MPELPEVEALVADLRRRIVGAVVAEVELGSFSVLKTYDPSPSALAGQEITGVARYGKFIDIDAGGLHLVIHFAKAGWLRVVDSFGDKALTIGSGQIAARVRLDSVHSPAGSKFWGFDVTEAGTRKGLAVHIVGDPGQVEAIAGLGPDALGEFDLAAITAGRRMQVKRLLREQKLISGIGNAYSDEILHAARLSPFAIAADLDAVQVEQLRAAIAEVLGAACAATCGRSAAELKDDKRSRMKVHGRAGQACPTCGDRVGEVEFSDSSLQYCPGCQTGGKQLKNRSISKFLT